MPGAEVVQGHPDAVAAQFGEGVGGPPGVVQQQPFGDLQLERVGRHLVAHEVAGDALGEARVEDVARRDVDRDLHLQPLLAPVGELADGGLQHVVGEPGHQAAGLGQPDELVRGDLPLPGPLPAQQRLQADHPAVEGHLRLVVQLHLAGLQGPPQVPEQPDPVRRVGVLGFVVLGDAAAAALGVAHRDVGPAQQRLGVLGVLRVDADAAAGLQDEQQPVQPDRGGQLGDQCLGDPFQAVRAVDAGQQDGELVAAHPGHHGPAAPVVPGQAGEDVVDGLPGGAAGRAAGAQCPVQPAGDVNQQPVTGRMTECVVE